MKAHIYTETHINIYSVATSAHRHTQRRIFTDTHEGTHINRDTHTQTQSHTSAHKHTLRCPFVPFTVFFFNHNIAACSIWSQLTTGARVIQVFSVCPVPKYFCFVVLARLGIFGKEIQKGFLCSFWMVPGSLALLEKSFMIWFLPTPFTSFPTTLWCVHLHFKQLKIFFIMEFFGDPMKGMDPLLQYMDICTLKQCPEYNF